MQLSIVILPLVSNIVSDVVEIDRDIGAVLVDQTELSKVPPPLNRLLLKALLGYVSGQFMVSFTAAKAVSVLASLTRGTNRTMTECDCYIRQYSDDKLIIIKSRHKNRVPIAVGEPVMWENRFLISLKKLTPQTRHDNETYYINFFGNVFRNDHARYSSIWRRPSHLLKLVPVILNKRNKVVAIPHLGVTDPSHKVTCTITHKTLYSLEELI